MIKGEEIMGNEIAHELLEFYASEIILKFAGDMDTAEKMYKQFLDSCKVTAEEERDCDFPIVVKYRKDKTSDVNFETRRVDLKEEVKNIKNHINNKFKEFTNKIKTDVDEKKVDENWRKNPNLLFNIIRERNKIPSPIMCEEFSSSVKNNNDNDLRFISELIQNTDDCYYTEAFNKLEIEFHKKEKSIVLKYPEKGFTSFDIIALSGINESSKADDNKMIGERIGEKGRGFKSIFKFFSNVTIDSCEYHFHYKTNEGTTMFQPCFGGKYEGRTEGTILTLNYDDENNREFDVLVDSVLQSFGIRDINKLFCNNPVFFTRNISALSIVVYDNDGKKEEEIIIENKHKRKQTENDKNIDNEKKKVWWEKLPEDTDNRIPCEGSMKYTYKKKGTKEAEGELLLSGFVKYIDYTDEEIKFRYEESFDSLSDDEKEMLRQKIHRTMPIIMMGLNEISEKSKKSSDIRISDFNGHMYSYLPTSMNINIPFIFQVPFLLTSNRSCSEENSLWNERLWREIFENDKYEDILLVKWFNECFNRCLSKKHSVFEYLPKSKCFLTYSDEESVSDSDHNEAADKTKAAISRINSNLSEAFFALFQEKLDIFPTVSGNRTSISKLQIVDSDIAKFDYGKDQKEATNVIWDACYEYGCERYETVWDNLEDKELIKSFLDCFGYKKNDKVLKFDIVIKEKKWEISNYLEKYSTDKIRVHFTKKYLEVIRDKCQGIEQEDFRHWPMDLLQFQVISFPEDDFNKKIVSYENFEKRSYDKSVWLLNTGQGEMLSFVHYFKYGVETAVYVINAEDYGKKNKDILEKLIPEENHIQSYSDLFEKIKVEYVPTEEIYKKNENYWYQNGISRYLQIISAYYFACILSGGDSNAKNFAKKELFPSKEDMVWTLKETIKKYVKMNRNNIWGKIQKLYFEDKSEIRLYGKTFCNQLNDKYIFDANEIMDDVKFLQSVTSRKWSEMLKERHAIDEKEWHTMVFHAWNESDMEDAKYFLDLHFMDSQEISSLPSGKIEQIEILDTFSDDVDKLEDKKDGSEKIIIDLKKRNFDDIRVCKDNSRLNIDKFLLFPKQKLMFLSSKDDLEEAINGITGLKRIVPEKILKEIKKAIDTDAYKTKSDAIKMIQILQIDSFRTDLGENSFIKEEKIFDELLRILNSHNCSNIRFQMVENNGRKWLEILYSGERALSPQDILSFTLFGATKSVENAVNRAVGLKSLYKLFDCIQVTGNGFHLKYDNTYQVNRQDLYAKLSEKNQMNVICKEFISTNFSEKKTEGNEFFVEEVLNSISKEKEQEIEDNDILPFPLIQNADATENPFYDSENANVSENAFSDSGNANVSENAFSDSGNSNRTIIRMRFQNDEGVENFRNQMKDLNMKALFLSRCRQLDVLDRETTFGFEVPSISDEWELNAGYYSRRTILDGIRTAEGEEVVLEVRFPENSENMNGNLFSTLPTNIETGGAVQINIPSLTVTGKMDFQDDWNKKVLTAIFCENGCFEKLYISFADYLVNLLKKDDLREKEILSVYEYIPYNLLMQLHEEYYNLKSCKDHLSEEVNRRMTEFWRKQWQESEKSEFPTSLADLCSDEIYEAWKKCGKHFFVKEGKNYSFQNMDMQRKEWMKTLIQNIFLSEDEKKKTAYYISEKNIADSLGITEVSTAKDWKNIFEECLKHIDNYYNYETCFHIIKNELNSVFEEYANLAMDDRVFRNENCQVKELKYEVIKTDICSYLEQNNPILWIELISIEYLNNLPDAKPPIIDLDSLQGLVVDFDCSVYDNVMSMIAQDIDKNQIVSRDGLKVMKNAPQKLQGRYLKGILKYNREVCYLVFGDPVKVFKNILKYEYRIDDADMKKLTYYPMDRNNNLHPYNDLLPLGTQEEYECVRKYIKHKFDLEIYKEGKKILSDSAYKDLIKGYLMYQYQLRPDIVLRGYGKKCPLLNIPSYVESKWKNASFANGNAIIVFWKNLFGINLTIPLYGSLLAKTLIEKFADPYTVKLIKKGKKDAILSFVNGRHPDNKTEQEMTREELQNYLEILSKNINDVDCNIVIDITLHSQDNNDEFQNNNNDIYRSDNNGDISKTEHMVLQLTAVHRAIISYRIDQKMDEIKNQQIKGEKNHG